MLTTTQIQDIGRYYIHPIYSLAAEKIGEDPSIEAFISGHCYYYAKELVKFLHGEGKIVCFDNSHYFVEYNHRYYDGIGEIKQDKWCIYLWDYENGFKACNKPDKNRKRNLYYQGTDEKYDGLASHTMDKYRNIVWNIFRIGTEDIEEELIAKLKDAKDDEEFRSILSEYAKKATDKIKTESVFDKMDDGSFKVGKVKTLILDLTKRTPEEQYELEKKALKEFEEEMALRHVPWHAIHCSEEYITDDEPDMVKIVREYVLRFKKKKEDN